MGSSSSPEVAVTRAAADLTTATVWRHLFAFFLISGFCSLVYEVVWLRLAMAAFGVTTPMVSVVLSVFMAGLALGSFGVGRFAGKRATAGASRFMRMYALAEAVIGASVLVVPWALALGGRLAGATGSAWGSLGHYVVSGLWVAVVTVPFCTAMGATFPLAMAYLERQGGAESRRSFSYLYVANVLGATSGTLLSAFVLIELLGFRRTLWVTGLLNALLATLAVSLSRRGSGTSGRQARPAAAARGTRGDPSGRATLPMLFVTGLVSMGMEVAWTRQYTRFLGTVVYAFAVVLATYLGATFLGSWAYRWCSRGGRSAARLFAPAWVCLAPASLLPLLACDPRLPLPRGLGPGSLRVIVGVAPFCFVLGFLTSLLLDAWSKGRPEQGGRAYAVNVLGCILGPLVAGFGLLPHMREGHVLFVLALPFLAIGYGVAYRKDLGGLPPGAALRRTALLAGATGISLGLVTMTISYEQRLGPCEIRRDYNATVIAGGSETFSKRLLVNGKGMTTLTPACKYMAHLPLVHLDRPPRSSLVICFGMGTTFRSLMSWGAPATAVELEPSVPDLFGYFHADGPALARLRRARIVIDDGRRFLARSSETYDVITVDPPPPVEAAGSSLLYSRDFYAIVRSRLAPDGIIQQWLPGGDSETIASAARAISESFPYVRVFPAFSGAGYHFLASARPVPRLPPSVLVARLPAAAAADLTEWGPRGDPAAQLGEVVLRELAIGDLIALSPSSPTLTDDQPVNEYYLLRRLLTPAPAHGSRGLEGDNSP